MVNIVGCPPSSGSTFFADLLDSSSHTACGEEINIFSTKKFYDFHRFKKNILKRSLSSVYLYSEGINTNILHQYGLDLQSLNELMRQSSSASEFGGLFSKHFLTLRGKNNQGVVFEKTPQNIICIEYFLQEFKNSYFIFLVRNPVFVYNSMRNRGFSNYISLITWYHETAKFYNFRNHPRVLLVKYEELVKDPFKITRDIIHKTSGLQLNESDIKNGYEKNEYRKLFSIRLKSWDVKEVGTVIDSNKKKIREEYLREFSTLFQAAINPKYAGLVNIKSVSFEELLKYFGYHDGVSQEMEKIDKIYSRPKKVMKDNLRLFVRWALAFRNREALARDFFAFLNPVV